MQGIIHKNLFIHTTKSHHVRDLFVATILNVPETNLIISDQLVGPISVSQMASASQGFELSQM